MDVRTRTPVWGIIAITALLAAVCLSAAAAVPIAWQGSTGIAAGRGAKGPWRQNDSRYDYVDDPTVAIDAQGNISLAWVDQGRKDVLFRRLADGKPLNVSRNPATFSWLPRIALAPDAPRSIFILWQEIIFSGGSHGGDMLFARSDDGGATFSAPRNLSNSIGGDGKGRINKEVWHNGSYDLATGADGALYAAWTEYEGTLWFSRSADGGKNFSRPRRIAGDDAGPARAPSLVIGSDRTVYLAWTTGEDEGADIHVARSADGGDSFSEPLIVAASENYSDAPRLAVDGDGIVHLVFAESAGGPFARYHIRYARSRDGGRSFGLARDISTPLPPSIESASFPSLDLDAAGNLYVIWELFPDPRRWPRGLGITVSLDGGERFAPPERIPGSSDPAGQRNGSQQGLLMDKLAVNDAGAVAVVNSSFKQNAGSSVWLLRGRLAL